VEVKKRSEKAEQKIDELKSIVTPPRNRLDRVQSQLSGERQLRSGFDSGDLDLTGLMKSKT
jgi:hypothetical protein